MKKCLKAMIGASLAAALVLSGCSDIADIEESDSTSVESSRAASSISLVKAQGWLNSAYIVWNGSGSSWTVTCDGVAVDSLLTRKIGSQWRCDIPGLKSGSHTIKVASGSESISATVTVESHDRSGFAFSNGALPGAFKAV